MHLANFALPESRGDFGSGAVERMGPNGLLVVLFEHEREAASTPLFHTEGVPRRLRPEQFGRNQLQRAVGTQVGLQVFAHERGRAFCLYVVLGSWRNCRPLASLAEGVLVSLDIAPAPVSVLPRLFS